jgi:RND family efflux transporter MFP subunit
LAALAALALLAGCKKQNAFVPPPPATVGVAQPLRQTVTPSLELTGNTAPYNQVDLVARVEGFLQAINVQDGAVAHRGDTLFVIEPTPYQMKYQQAQAALASAQAAQSRSDAEFNRQASLGRSDFSSQSSVDQARANRDSDRANVANQQAAVTLAGVTLGYTNVAAPFDGVVTAHQVSVGNLVGATGPTRLASLIQLDPIYANFNVSEQDVLRIRAALAARGTTVADLGKVPVELGLMNEAGTPHKGVLDYIAPLVDSATGTLQIRAVFANPDRALLPGFFVHARIALAPQAGEALLVPDRALGADQAGRYLLLVKADDTVEQRRVRTGLLVGQLRVIEDGLGPDDRVVVSGLQRAIPGAKVAPRADSIAP